MQLYITFTPTKKNLNFYQKQIIFQNCNRLKFLNAMMYKKYR